MKEPNRIYAEIDRLQVQLEEYWDYCREKFDYTIQNGRVRFDRAVKAAHKEYKINLLSYFARARIAHILSAPFIYGMIVPLLFFDLTLNLYQQVCFRAYGIARVRRRDYLVMDRHLLSYLNSLEKFNCLYCSYGNGLVAFARDVLGRTEQYWCPIKHARRLKSPHKRYGKFSDYGDAKNYRGQLDTLRRELREE